MVSVSAKLHCCETWSNTRGIRFVKEKSDTESVARDSAYKGKEKKWKQTCTNECVPMTWLQRTETATASGVPAVPAAVLAPRDLWPSRHKAPVKGYRRRWEHPPTLARFSRRTLMFCLCILQLDWGHDVPTARMYYNIMHGTALRPDREHVRLAH